MGLSPLLDDIFSKIFVETPGIRLVTFDKNDRVRIRGNFVTQDIEYHGRLSMYLIQWGQNYVSPLCNCHHPLHTGSRSQTKDIEIHPTTSHIFLTQYFPIWILPVYLICRLGEKKPYFLSQKQSHPKCREDHRIMNTTILVWILRIPDTPIRKLAPLPEMFAH